MAERHPLPAIVDVSMTGKSIISLLTVSVPDLAFSEMQFLKQSSRQPADSEKEVIVSKSGQKTKRERERARNEISNYFVSARQPLEETGFNRGREASTLPSDAGRTEVTYIARGHHSHPPVSPERELNEKVLYEGFSTTRSTPQKFSLPKPKLDQIFIPRPPTESHNASRKSTSYCTWSESVRSPIARAKAIVVGASQNDRGMSPTSRQRIPVRTGIYKEVGIQAEIDSEVDSPYNPAVVRTHHDGNDSQVVISKPLKPANALSAHGMKGQNRTEYGDEDSIDQLQANRAVLHDCDSHRDPGRPNENLETRLESFHTKSPFDPKQHTDHVRQSTAEQSTQTGMGAVDRTQGNSVQPGQNPNSEEQSIMSRAVLAQRAYIKRRSTPKVAVEEVGGTSDGPALDTDVSNAIDSREPEENNGSLRLELIDPHMENETIHPQSGFADGRRNEGTSQPGQYQFHGSVPESNLPVYGQTQIEYIDAAGYQPNEPDDDRGYMTNEHGSHRIEDTSTSIHIEPPQLIIPTRGFSTGTAHIQPVQSRTISPLETMEPIYARQLQNQALEAQELQYWYNLEEQGHGAVFLYEGGQWERERLDAGAPQEYNPIEMVDRQVSYGDMYEGQQDELDLIDENMYYEEELPFDAEAQMHDTAAPAEMLFYTPASGPNAEYQWMPRQRTHFSGAADQPELGSWERLQSDRVPQELTMQFWRPRRGY